MLSYRKSQQASLTEKLKKKNVIHVLGVSGSGTTMARLCLSAFARVATGFLRVYRQRRPLCHSAFVRVATLRTVFLQPLKIFATAHSCGLRRRTQLAAPRQCAALPQRIRAGCGARNIALCRSERFATAHSCGLRQKPIWDIAFYVGFATAHSCGLRLCPVVPIK